MFYTYLWLREDGSPYYVGKGTLERAHRKGAPPEERIIVQEWLSEEQAFTAEIFLIAFYGRIDLGTGCLRNLTAGGEGIDSVSMQRRWAAMTAEQRRKMSQKPDTFGSTLSISTTGCRKTDAHRANLKAARNTAVYKQAQKDRVTTLWNDPAYRVKHIVAMTGKKHKCNKISSTERKRRDAARHREQRMGRAK